jgi:hypothetical protein
VAGFSPLLGLKFGYNLTPTLELFLGWYTYLLGGREVWLEYKPPNVGDSINFEDNTVFGGGIGLRFRYPFGYTGSRMFRFSKTEAVTGVSLYLELGIGFAYLGSWRLEWAEYDMGGGENWMDGEYFTATTNMLLISTLGIEYRWVNFSLFFEIGYLHFGTPAPSEDPLWVDSSVASDLFTLGTLAGLAVHF